MKNSIIFPVHYLLRLALQLFDVTTQKISVSYYKYSKNNAKTKRVTQLMSGYCDQRGQIWLTIIIRQVEFPMRDGSACSVRPWPLPAFGFRAHDNSCCNSYFANLPTSLIVTSVLRNFYRIPPIMLRVIAPFICDGN